MAYPYAVTGMNAQTTQDPTKPKKTLPTWDNATQPVPIAMPNQQPLRQSEQSNVQSQQGNDQVLQTAQQKSMHGYQSPLMDTVVEQTQNLLKDPNMGINYGQQKNLQLEQQNRNMNQQLETLRQQTAPTAYAGENLRNLTNVAMQAIQQRADTGRQIDWEQEKAKRENMISALTQGQTVAQQQRGAFDQDIQNLLQTRGAYEGEANRSQQSSMLDKTFMQDMEKLKATQNFSGAQASIERELQKSLAEGNWNNAIKLTQMKGEIDKQIQIQQQEFAKSERIADQGWKSTERISSQDFEKTIQYLQFENQKALQNKDFEKAKYLQEQDGLIRLKMQTNEMNAQEKMMYLQNSLAEAKATNDVDRQKQILTFTHAQEMETINKNHGFEQAMNYADQEFKRSMQNNDFMQARVLQQQQLSFQAKENLANRSLEEARIALQGKQIDMQGKQMSYEMLMQQVENGAVSPADAVLFVGQAMQQYGIKLTAVDAQKSAQEAIDAEYKSQEYAFAKSHPELKNNPEEMERRFMEYFNKAIYQETSVADLVNGIADVKQLQGGKDSANPNYSKYQTILSTAEDWKPVYQHDGRGVFKEDVEKITNAPAKGRYFKYNGNLFYASSDVIEEKSGENYEYFKAIDVNTGNTITIKANNPNDGLLNYVFGLSGAFLPKI